MDREPRPAPLQKAGSAERRTAWAVGCGLPGVQKIPKRHVRISLYIHRYTYVYICNSFVD